MAKFWLLWWWVGRVRAPWGGTWVLGRGWGGVLFRAGNLWKSRLWIYQLQISMETQRVSQAPLKIANLDEWAGRLGSRKWSLRRWGRGVMGLWVRSRTPYPAPTPQLPKTPAPFAIATPPSKKNKWATMPHRASLLSAWASRCRCSSWVRSRDRICMIRSKFPATSDPLIFIIKRCLVLVYKAILRLMGWSSHLGLWEISRKVGMFRKLHWFRGILRLLWIQAP